MFAFALPFTNTVVRPQNSEFRYLISWAPVCQAVYSHKISRYNGEFQSPIMWGFVRECVYIYIYIILHVFLLALN